VFIKSVFEIKMDTTKIELDPPLDVTLQIKLKRRSSFFNIGSTGEDVSNEKKDKYIETLSKEYKEWAEVINDRNRRVKE
jgi:hypothetical protein